MISFLSRSAARSAILRACLFSRLSVSSAMSCRARPCVYIHLTLCRYSERGELKTKPTQHSVKELRSIGIQPDILLCRADRPIPDNERRKIALFCNVRPSAVIQALDVKSIYDVPVAYHREGLDTEVLEAFGIKDAKKPDLSRWRLISDRIWNPEGEVNIAVVGKYTGLLDAYKSLNEALVHGGIANKVRVNLDWIESEIFESEDPAPHLEGVHGILVPGGLASGARKAKSVPPPSRAAATFLISEFASGCRWPSSRQRAIWRGLRKRARPNSVNTGTGDRIDDGMDEGKRAGAAQKRRRPRRTMRLGAYEALLAKDSRVAAIYGTTRISERHRHRYEVNINTATSWRLPVSLHRPVARRLAAGNRRIQAMSGLLGGSFIPSSSPSPLRRILFLHPLSTLPSSRAGSFEAAAASPSEANFLLLRASRHPTRGQS